MSGIGANHPCFAPFAGETTSALPTYGTGFCLGGLIKNDVTLNYAEGEEYSDDALSDRVREFSSGAIAMDVNDISMAHTAKLYGATYSDSELSYGKNDNAPYGGYAYYRRMRRNGQTYFEAHFYPKVQASRGNESVATKGNSITLSPKSVNLVVFSPLYGKYEYVKEFDTESAAAAWCETKTNVATWYMIEVGVTGTGTVSPVGVTPVAASGSFELAITGTVTKLYDDGADVTSSISDGKYTLSSVAADHKIVAVFTA